MAALITLFLLSLVIGELLCKSRPDSLPTSTTMHWAYTREALLTPRQKGDTPPTNLPAAVTGKAAGRSSRRKRGQRGGVRQRLRRRGNKPPLPSIILSNVRSLRSKSDELRFNSRFCHEYRESSIMVFTESCLRQDIPDASMELEGFTMVCADRESSSGESRCGGICVYVSNQWCNQYTVRDTHCDSDLELLCLSLRPFCRLRPHTTPTYSHSMLDHCNHCSLELVLPGFYQYVK